MKKINKYLKFGFLFYIIFLIGNYTSLLPEFLKGLFIGLSIVLLLIGSHQQSNQLAKIKNFKKNLVKKVIFRK